MTVYFVVCLAVKYFEDNESITIVAIKNLDLKDTTLKGSGRASDKMIRQKRQSRV